jgi:hypothetical protein
MKRIAVALVIPCLVACAATMPKSFVKTAPGWRSVELHETLRSDYDLAWQKTVDTVARSWDIEIMDKGSGYLRTTWLYGISGANPQLYRGRLTIKFPDPRKPTTFDIRTSAQWLQNRKSLVWVDGFDTDFERDVYTELAGRLGRTVPTD